MLAGSAMLTCGLYHEAVWAVLALLGNLGLLAYLATQRWRPLAELRAGALAAWWHIRGRQTPAVGVWGLAILFCLGSALPLASFPPDARDELVYHLALPHLWGFQPDWWVPLDNLHWLFPANAELIWGYGLGVGECTPRASSRWRSAWPRWPCWRACWPSPATTAGRPG